MQERNYAKHSWELLTQQPGWIKPVLVLSAAMLVPIVGSIGVTGYGLEWARLTAWGVDAAPKQKNVQVGKLIASGWRAVVISLVIVLCFSAVVGLLSFVANLINGSFGTLLELLIQLVASVAELFLGVFISIASVRAAIYEKISAGLRLDRVLDMVKRDFGGFCHLLLLVLAAGFVAAILIFVIILIAGVGLMPSILMAANASSGDQAMAMMLQAMGPVLGVGLIFGYGLSILGNAYSLVYINAVALWMRQFDVPSWGRSEDPLPQTATPEPSSNAPMVAMPEPQETSVPDPQPVQQVEPAPVVTPEEPEPDSTNEAPMKTAPIEPRPTTPLEVRDDAEIAEDGDPELSAEHEVEGQSQDVDSLYRDLYDVIESDDNDK